VRGKNNYVFFFISSKSRKITAYHIEKSRDTLPANRYARGYPYCFSWRRDYSGNRW
jgi:hypothetical protein